MTIDGLAIGHWRLGLTIGDWIDDWGMVIRLSSADLPQSSIAHVIRPQSTVQSSIAHVTRPQSTIQSSIATVNRQSSIDNPIFNRHCQSAIANRQSVNLQSPIFN